MTTYMAVNMALQFEVLDAECGAFTYSNGSYDSLLSEFDARAVYEAEATG